MQEYLNRMIEVQYLLLEYIDDDSNDKEKFNELIQLFNDQKIFENKHQLRSVIHLLASIIDFHYRTNFFYNKIFNIILFLKDELLKNYSNFEIYYFFKNNQRIILFLSEEKIITLDKSIASKMCDENYCHEKTILNEGIYFFPEIKQYIDERCYMYKEIPKNIKELRKIEYGDNQILQLIQKDLLNEFIIYVNKTNFNLNNTIKSSLFETNYYLYGENSLIEYAAFFGSIKIFKYLITQDCIVDPKLMKYAIHGRNPEIIHFINDNTEIDEKTYKECLKISIKCHYNELTNFILNKYFENKDISSYVLKHSLKSHNFSLIHLDLINTNSLFTLCQNDYYIFASTIIQENKDIDINFHQSKEYFDDDFHVKIEKTLLYCAIENSNLDIVQLLIEHENIDINKKSLIKLNEENMITPLHAAIENGNIKIVKSIIDHKDIDINMRSMVENEERTPLYFAIRKNNIEIIQLLMAKEDIDINLKSLDYYEVLDETSYIYYTQMTPLHQAISYKNMEIIKILLGHKNIDVNAITSKKIIYFYDFHEDDSNIYCIDTTPLIEAIFHNQIEIIKLLLDRKDIDVNIKYQDKYDFDNWDAEKMKIKDKMRGKTYNKSKYRKIMDKTALYIAIEKKYCEIVRLLLGNENIDVNEKSLIKSCEIFGNHKRIMEEEKSTELTPLYLAVENENCDIVQILIGHKNIDVNLKSVSTCTNYVSIYKNVDEEQNEDEFKKIEKSKEETSIHNAVSKGNMKIIQVLLNHKDIDINSIDKQMRKPIELSTNEDVRSLFNEL